MFRFAQDLRRPGGTRMADQQGATLMELVVGMAVSMIFMAGVMTVLIVAFHDQSTVDARTQEASQTNVAVERLDADIRNVAVTCSSGEGLSGGVTVAVTEAYQSLEFCEPSPSAPLSVTSTTTTPTTQVVEWYCSTPTSGTGSCRRYSATSATAINTTVAVNTTIYGIKAMALSGVLQSAAGTYTASTTALNASASYPLTPSSTAAGLSWLGITLTLVQLADPGSTVTTTVPDTQPIQIEAGGELRNFQA